MMDVTQSRGYRNKNPGNIDHVPANKWQGLADPPIEKAPRRGVKPRFAVFTSHQYGIRALACLLITYQDRHKLRTPRAIVNRWAPGKENDTDAYVAAVCRRGGWSDGQVLDMHSYADLRPMVEAIIRHELGGQPYPAHVIDEGLTMAGVPPSGVRTARTTQAAAGTAVAGIGTAAAVEAAATLAPHASGAADLARAVGPWVVAMIVVAVAVYFVWQRAKAQRAVAA